MNVNEKAAAVLKQDGGSCYSIAKKIGIAYGTARTILLGNSSKLNNPTLDKIISAYNLPENYFEDCSDYRISMSERHTLGIYQPRVNTPRKFNDDGTNTVSNIMKRYIHAQGMSISDFSELHGIPRKTISIVTGNRMKKSMSLLQNIAKTIGQPDLFKDAIDIDKYADKRRVHLSSVIYNCNGLAHKDPLTLSENERIVKLCKEYGATFDEVKSILRIPINTSFSDMRSLTEEDAITLEKRFGFPGFFTDKISTENLMRILPHEKEDVTVNGEELYNRLTHILASAGMTTKALSESIGYNIDVFRTMVGKEITSLPLSIIFAIEDCIGVPFSKLVSREAVHVGEIKTDLGPLDALTQENREAVMGVIAAMLVMQNK